MAKKKVGSSLLILKRPLLEPHHSRLSIVRQCQLLEIPRSSYYFLPAPESQENLLLMRLLDEQYTKTPFYGIRRMTVFLNTLGMEVNHKRVQRLMRLMGIEAIYPKKRLSQGENHKIYPYLLRGVEIKKVNQVWSTDITYIPMKGGFVYLVAIMDWYSRYVLAWEISTTLEVNFCLAALERALEQGKPEIFNTDQGSQFTSKEFTGRLEKGLIQISMDGRGRVFDNIFIERLWRSVKYEEVYLKEYETVRETKGGIGNYFCFYNEERPHQALEYKTPAYIYKGEE